MGYRDDRQALKDRIAELERQAAGAVSREELAGLRAELAESRARLDQERAAIDALLERLDGKMPRPRRRLLLALLGAVTVLMLAVLVLIATGPFWLVTGPDEPVYEGAPGAARQTPARVEVDEEVEARWSTLDACLPEGDSARIQAQVVFEGRNGAARAVELLNVSEHDGYSMLTHDCLRDALRALSVPPFRARSYRYGLTLEWSGEGLRRPPIWDRSRR
ncbi:MAG: hypothetical protein VYE22_17095 [Myxococcota bacterium]|nr:hypothetical protein [Myxococcota bacterium]